jgi:hypothetical protein
MLTRLDEWAWALVDTDGTLLNSENIVTGASVRTAAGRYSLVLTNTAGQDEILPLVTIVKASLLGLPIVTQSAGYDEASATVAVAFSTLGLLGSDQRFFLLVRRAIVGT